MDITITTIGALIGLAVAIILIIKKIEPAYSMIAGAFVGGVIGGAGRNRFLHDNRSTEHYACDSSNRNIRNSGRCTDPVRCGSKDRRPDHQDFWRKKSIIFSGTCNNDSDSSWCIW